MTRLGVNVDHVATIRQARYRKPERGAHPEPNPVEFALIAQKAGAHGITAHLREDRRHMQLNDLQRLSQKLRIPLNLEMAATDTMTRIACDLKPKNVCLVPENRQEVTTEGGLNVVNGFNVLGKVIEKLRKHQIKVSLFVDPIPKQIVAAAVLGADFVELHTGLYSLAINKRENQRELKRLSMAAQLAHQYGLSINAGHGLNYQNVKQILQIPYLYELNIGHTIVSRAVMVGAKQAVEEMLRLVTQSKFKSK